MKDLFKNKKSIVLLFGMLTNNVCSQTIDSSQVNTIHTYKRDTSLVQISSTAQPITVNVYFNVDENGEVQNPKAREIDCETCDKSKKKQYKQEAEQVVAKMPKGKITRAGKYFLRVVFNTEMPAPAGSSTTR